MKYVANEVNFSQNFFCPTILCLTFTLQHFPIPAVLLVQNQVCCFVTVITHHSCHLKAGWHFVEIKHWNYLWLKVKKILFNDTLNCPSLGLSLSGAHAASRHWQCCFQNLIPMLKLEMLTRLVRVTVTLVSLLGSTQSSQILLPLCACVSLSQSCWFDMFPCRVAWLAQPPGIGWEQEGPFSHSC